MDTDLDHMTREGLITEVKKLRQGIREHRDSSRDELCWHHPLLWGLLPERTDPLPVVPEWSEFIRGCVRYRQSLDEQVPNAPRTNDEQAIRNLVAHWHRATAAGDVDAILRLMAEDVVFLVAGRPPMKGRSTFEQGLRGVLASHQIDSRAEIQEVEMSGDLAYCWSVLTVRMAPRAGDAIVRSGSALSVFRRQTNGAWGLKSDANLLPPE